MRRCCAALTAQSITLFVVPGVAVPPPIPPALSAAVKAPGTFAFTLTGQTGTNYVIQSSSDLVNWSPVSTNTLTGSSSNLLFTVPDAVLFYRTKVAQ
ncbi:MAG TPA: hypothetical protein VFD66_07190 [Verrucomicrobiae bacterium]|nr:hypothetical protein [Verrucomicrobiae bacterium]